MSSREMADRTKHYINTNSIAPPNPLGNAQGKSKRAGKLYIKASSTPFTGNTYETIVKTAVANALPRLAMLSGGDIYVDPSYKDGRVVNAAGELLLWVAVTHEDTDSTIEIYAANCIFDRISSQISRIITEMLNNTDAPITEGTDLNSIYQKYSDEITTAQEAADIWIQQYLTWPEEQKVPNGEYRRRSKMYTYLTEPTKLLLLNDLDALHLLVTYERKEHI